MCQPGQRLRLAQQPRLPAAGSLAPGSSNMSATLLGRCRRIRGHRAFHLLAQAAHGGLELPDLNVEGGVRQRRLGQLEHGFGLLGASSARR